MMQSDGRDAFEIAKANELAAYRQAADLRRNLAAVSNERDWWRNECQRREAELNVLKRVAKRK